MRKLLRMIAAAVLGVTLSAGLVAAEASIDTTGPDSTNRIVYDNNTDVDLDNDTDVDLDVDNDQDADSGDARVEDNTTGGDATTGDASNSHELNVDVNVDNSSSSSAALAWGGCGCDGDASIDNTGPDSRNTIRFDNRVDIDVDNKTDFDLDFDNDQDADSGDAKVEHNTTGGDATSGNASNSSSTTVNLSVTN